MEGYLKSTALRTIMEYENTLIKVHLDLINKLMTHLCEGEKCSICETNKKFHEQWQTEEKTSNYLQRIELLKKLPIEILRYLHI
jgi:hypothetical protein